jgi:hypothetical protein
VEARCVPNPAQARHLLASAKITPRSGERLYAFFACLYFAGLRPEEAVNLRQKDLELPTCGWDWIVLTAAAPDAGSAWTDDGAQRQQRQLKHRAVGETRRVPCPPELVTILREHLEKFGTDTESRFFQGERGGELATVTYTRLWRRARITALGEAKAATSPLARRHLRPAPRSRIHLVRGRRITQTDRRMGRPQPRRPPQDLRQGPGRAPRDRSAPDRRHPQPIGLRSGTTTRAESAAEADAPPTTPPAPRHVIASTLAGSTPRGQGPHPLCRGFAADGRTWP